MSALLLKQDESWPFRLHITDENGVVLITQNRYAYGTKQKTLKDVMSAYSFKRGEEQDSAVAQNKNQLELMQRIVACVNACRGLDTKNLESSGLVSSVGYEMLNIETQRDKLLASAKNVIRDALDRVDVHPCDENDDDVKQRGLSSEKRHLYQVIAEIEGKA